MYSLPQSTPQKVLKNLSRLLAKMAYCLPKKHYSYATVVLLAAITLFMNRSKPLVANLLKNEENSVRRLHVTCRLYKKPVHILVYLN